MFRAPKKISVVFKLLLILSVVFGLSACNKKSDNNDNKLEYRTFDGTNNSLLNPNWGAVNTQLARLTASDYGDGISTLSGQTRPNPRAISNAVASQTTSMENDRNLSSFVWAWGQFLDHDIDLTPAAEPPEDASIPVPTGDAFFDPGATGTQLIEFSRSIFDEETGTSTDNPREQLNVITAWIDGSVVYGSSKARADWLRTFESGMMKTSAGDLLAFNDGTLDNAGGKGTSLFVGGDIRANENIVLTSLHTLFVREHNRIASILAQNNPPRSDEEVYQEARKFVGAFIQAITFQEFLPALLGNDAIPAYAGYDDSINPSIFNEFSTAFFRIGHSMLPNELLRLNEDGTTSAFGNIPLSNAFFNPNAILNEGGIDPLLRGIAAQFMQEVDIFVVDGVRNFLFGNPGMGGFDLPSLNIQRGRDHGITDYQSIRNAIGMSVIAAFTDINSNMTVTTRLQSIYPTLADIDPWVGALAESHVPGGSVGELTLQVLVDQFTRLRDADRFWFENDPFFSATDIARIKGLKLADIIMRNTDIENIQRNVFFVSN